MRHVSTLFTLVLTVCLAGCAEDKKPLTPAQVQEQRQLVEQNLLEEKRPVQWDASKPVGPYQVSFSHRSNYNDIPCDDAANKWVARYGNDVTVLSRMSDIAGTYSAIASMVTLVYEVHPPTSK